MSEERFGKLERLIDDTRARLSALEDLDDRVDGHDADIAAIRAEMRALRRDLHAMRGDLSRVIDSQSTHTLTLDKVHGLLEHLVRVMTPTVQVKP